jgi:MoaA/NifB/PqqE/SkfB family radical SAM enzyme
MTKADWSRVLAETAAIGVRRVQLIGGEPTLHPEFSELVLYALGVGLDVEVFSNLARSFSDELWQLFELPRVRLATSYYSDDAAQHDAITGGLRSHERTLGNIREALRRGIRLRAGVIAMRPGQLGKAAVEQLHTLGVEQVDYDELRQLGRGVRDRQPNGIDQLCGSCGNRRLAVSPTGEVWPCPMSRWMVLGNVSESSLASIFEGSAATRHQLRREMQTFDDSDGGCAAPLCCNPALTD